MIFQCAHHGQDDVLAPPRRGDLKADGQTRAPLFGSSRGPVYAVSIRYSIAFLPGANPTGSDYSRRHAEQIVEPGVAVEAV